MRRTPRLGHPLPSATPAPGSSRSTVAGRLLAHPRRAGRRTRGATATVAAVLLVVVAAGLTLRLQAIDHPRGNLAADERAYLRLAGDLRMDGTYGDGGLDHPHHWAPGTPALFSAAETLGDTPPGDRVPQAPLRAQAVVGTLTVLAAFGVAALIGGPVAGLAAATGVALYPPSLQTAWFFVSEPLGGLTLTAATLALLWAWRRGGPRWIAAGVAFALACLARADVLLPAVGLLLLAGALLARRGGLRSAAGACVLALAAFAVALAPWTLYASSRTGSFVPVTDGATSTLLVATYLPRDSRIIGLKRAYAAEVRRTHPRLRRTPTWAIPASAVMDVIAAKRPELGRQAPLSAELREHVRRYVLGRPLAFAGLEARKLWRMWGGYYHGGHRPIRPAVLWWHRVLCALALAGLLAGLAATRRAELGLVLAALLLATAVGIAFVAEPRHNIRLVPLLLAGGAAGWALLVRHRMATRRSPAGA